LNNGNGQDRPNSWVTLRKGQGFSGIGRVRFKPSFQHWIDSVVTQPGYAFAPIDLDLISSSLENVPHAELFDTAIVATARLKAAPLITKDELITKKASVEIYW
jgi:PIN domain nuclease of toxin-antitoxin system